MHFKSRHRQRGYFLAPLVPYIAGAATAASAGAAVYSATKGAPKVPLAPQPATQDTAANAANQQSDLMRKRRGVLANIAAGSNATAPQVSAKSTLGS